MPIEECQSARAGRLAALYCETAAARPAASLAAALALAVQALPKGDLVLPMAHAVCLGTPLPELLRAAGRRYRLAGCADALDALALEQALRAGRTGAALFVQAPQVAPVMMLAPWLWQVRQAGLASLVIAPDPDDALGMADSHVDLIVTRIAGLGMIAGRSAMLAAIENSSWAAIAAVPAGALPGAVRWLEARLEQVEEIGQIAGCEHALGPYGRFGLTAHPDGTLSEELPARP